MIPTNNFWSLSLSLWRFYLKIKQYSRIINFILQIELLAVTTWPWPPLLFVCLSCGLVSAPLLNPPYLPYSLLWNSPNLVFDSVWLLGNTSHQILVGGNAGTRQWNDDCFFTILNSNVRSAVAAFPPTNIWWLLLQYELKSKEARMSIEWP